MTLSFSLCNRRPSRPFKCHSQGCCKVIVRSTFDVDIRLQTRLRLQMTMRTSGDTPISGGIFESPTFGQTPKVFVQNAWRPTRPTTKWCSAVSLPGSLSRPPETAKIHKVISFDSFSPSSTWARPKLLDPLGKDLQVKKFLDNLRVIPGLRSTGQRVSLSFFKGNPPRNLGCK
jgi:hypothetical protein